MKLLLEKDKFVFEKILKFEFQLVRRNYNESELDNKLAT